MSEIADMLSKGLSQWALGDCGTAMSSDLPDAAFRHFL